MSPNLLIPALLLSLCVCLSVSMTINEDNQMVHAILGQDCSLECTAKHKSDVQYMAVRWYKFEETSSSRLGLLTRALPNGTTRWYAGLEREVKLLGESRSLFLPNITCRDSGMYICHLAAPLGEQNRDGQVHLIVTDCPVGPTESSVADTYLVFFASAVLMVALVIFLISYSCMKNTLKERINKPTQKQILLDAPLKPLDKKDLMLIYTLGPKKSSLKHICV